MRCFLLLRGLRRQLGSCRVVFFGDGLLLSVLGSFIGMISDI